MKQSAGAPLTRRLEDLYRFERSGMRLGLTGIERLLLPAGRPDRAFPSVLIAGTNGKGSTAAHLASIFRAAGLKTGLFTSPHLVRFHERIRVDGREIDDASLEALLTRWWPRFETERPSFFEAVTALCFDHFAGQELGMAVVEVGLGGRLDATNVLEPRASVITTIASDHTEILGRTLREIAIEKAGIVKKDGVLILGVRAPGPRDVILDVARERGARVKRLGTDARYAATGVTPLGTEFQLSTESFAGVLRTPLLGVHQARNAALAALTAEAVLGEMGRDRADVAQAIERGVSTTTWPARAEWIDGDPPILLDVAHNVEGALALAATVRALCPSRPISVVAAFSRDKAHAAILEALAPIASRFTLTEFAGERATPAAVLLGTAPAHGIASRAVPAASEAVSEAIEWARSRGGLVLITGSFYLMPQALAALGREVPRAI
jgi:dihydrofolate synthase/folylpolyglutamate synthase